MFVCVWGGREEWYANFLSYLKDNNVRSWLTYVVYKSHDLSDAKERKSGHYVEFAWHSMVFHGTLAKAM